MLLQAQNLFTLTPLLFSILLAIMIITKKWKQDIILTVFLAIDEVCTTLFLYGYVEIGFIVVDVTSVVVVLYSLFRKRRK